MVSYTKRPEAPASLAAQRSYTEEDTVTALREDSHNKCYICEILRPTSINVEHFTEHRGNVALKFHWPNLMYACSHCNNTKNDLFRTSPSTIINCTDPEQFPDLWIEYRLDISDDLKVIAKITQNLATPAPAYQQQIDNTIRLLDAVYNGTKTAIRSQEAFNLRVKLTTELRNFQQKLFEYLTTTDAARKSQLKTAINQEIENASEFTAFKKWMLRDRNIEFPIT